MTKHKACETLGIDLNASTEEIKVAYAELSKKYHPEENPEDFQQIHEAYTMLVRGNRTRRQSTNVNTVNLEMGDKSQTKSEFGDEVFSNIEDAETSYEEKMSQFDFESSENRVQQEMQEKYLVELQQAVDKLDNIFLSYDNMRINTYILQRQMETLQFDILHNTSYVNKLYSLLQTREWDDETYKVIIKYMHLWDQELLQGRQDLAEFKLFLDEKNISYKSANEQESVRIIGGIITALLIFCFYLFRIFMD